MMIVKWIMTWLASEHVFRWAGEWIDCCDAWVRDNFWGLHRRCSLRSAHQHWPCSFRKWCACPILLLSSYVIVLPRARLFSGLPLIALLIACWCGWAHHLSLIFPSLLSFPLESCASVRPSNPLAASISIFWIWDRPVNASLHHLRHSLSDLQSPIHWKNQWDHLLLSQPILQLAGQSLPMLASPFSYAAEMTVQQLI